MPILDMKEYSCDEPSCEAREIATKLPEGWRQAELVFHGMMCEGEKYLLLFCEKHAREVEDANSAFGAAQKVHEEALARLSAKLGSNEPRSITLLKPRKLA